MDLGIAIANASAARALRGLKVVVNNAHQGARGVANNRIGDNVLISQHILLEAPQATDEGLIRVMASEQHRVFLHV
jgi:hypothetical protein